jgi:predicted amidohydrolase YtcJ
MPTRLVLVLATAPIALAAAALAQQGSPPDLIVHNARVYTANPAVPRAEAVAIRDGRFVYVGTSEGALAAKGAGTRVVDAGGETVLPGLHDAHAHFTGLGASLQMLDLRDAASYDEVLARVREGAGRARPGEWIVGRSWDQNRWPVKEWPTREPLDEAAPHNPVYLTRVDGHAALANTAALELGGVTADTPDPEGGRIIRDAKGRPAGVLVDRAMGLVAGKIPPVSDAQLEEQILLADAETRRLGLTMVHDAGADERTVAAYRRLSEAGKLHTRLYVMLRLPLERLEPFFAKGPDTGGGDLRVVVRAIKISLDGALGSRGAAMLEPYSDEPGTRGLLVTSPDDTLAMTRAAARAGFQTCIHAIGDRANRLVLDIFEQVQREVPGARALRLRNEHAQILHPDDIPRFARLGVVASMQGTHATSDMPWVPARIGEQRMRQGAYVWRALLDSGATIANGSDFPVELPDPLLGFHASITRQDTGGRPPGGWMPEQRMTREETLASFTIDAAFAAHAERVLGSIEVGKLADLTMLSDDVMTIAPEAITKARVRRTIVGGRVVFEQ